PVREGVAILSQSGNILLNLTMQGRGLPIAYAIAAGNQAQMGAAEIGAELLRDARVTALGLHVEGLGDIAALEALAAEACALGKRVVVLKVGRSEAARAAGLSHTAALSGSAAGAAALLDRLGIVRVESLGAFLQALSLCHGRLSLTAPLLAVMSCSGGEAGLAADAAADRGLTFPALTGAQQGRLGSVLGDRVALANPLDYHTYIWGDEPRLAAMIQAMLEGPVELGIVLLDFPRDACGASPDWDRVVTAAAQARAATRRPLAILSTLPDLMPDWRVGAIRAEGLLPLAGLEDAFDAIAAVARRSARDGAAVWRPCLADPGDVVPEAVAKANLEAHGLDIPRGRVAQSPEDAGAAAAELGGKVVLKGQGAAHKSEAGLVALGLTGAASVMRRAQGMGATEFLVEEMIEGGIAEMLVGVVSDPAHGFVMTIGAGGVLTEVLADAQSLILPAPPEAIEAALNRLKIAPVLAGYRGKPGVDRAVLVRAIQAVQDFVGAHADRLVELELNPLIVTANRAVAADALLIWGED
ncbi:MAG: acetate--CoA ligase family protein, partial [Pseudomonadota bacterium]